MNENNKIKVAANVVTYNRKQLLSECLNALLKQTYPLDAIYIIDNASTDDTSDFLIERGFINKQLIPDREPVEAIKSIPLYQFSNKTVEIHYVRMHKNTGSAGGQYEGVRRGYKAGFDWLWLMDDDTIPKNDALEILISKSKISKNIGFLCSKVFWKDNILHLRSTPSLKNYYILKDNSQILFNLFEEQGALIVDKATFVSLLINKDAIKAVGYPIKEFFIWADDLEYTFRIFNKGFLGLYVAGSHVIHKTNTNNSSIEVDTNRIDLYFYHARNITYLSKTFGVKSLLRQILLNIIYSYNEAKKLRNKDRIKFIFFYLYGTYRGIIFLSSNHSKKNNINCLYYT